VGNPIGPSFFGRNISKGKSVEEIVEVIEKFPITIQ
jgi:hypothetical protein